MWTLSATTFSALWGRGVPFRSGLSPRWMRRGGQSTLSCLPYMEKLGREQKSIHYHRAVEACRVIEQSPRAFIQRAIVDGPRRDAGVSLSPADDPSLWILYAHVNRAALAAGIELTNASQFADVLGGDFAKLADVVSQLTAIDIASLAYFKQRPDKPRAPEWMRKLLYLSCPTCGICGEPILNIRELEVDHVVPRSKKGLTKADNVQLAHFWCNRSKSTKLLPSVFGEESPEE